MSEKQESTLREIALLYGRDYVVDGDNDAQVKEIEAFQEVLSEMRERLIATVDELTQ